MRLYFTLLGMSEIAAVWDVTSWGRQEALDPSVVLPAGSSGRSC